MLTSLCIHLRLGLLNGLTSAQRVHTARCAPVCQDTAAGWKGKDAIGAHHFTRCVILIISNQHRGFWLSQTAQHFHRGSE